MAIQAGSAQEHLTAKTKQGEGAFALLRRYLLPTDVIAIAKFKEMNKGYLAKNEQLQRNHSYKLPVMLIPYDGLSISSSLGIDDRNRINQIDLYNFQTFEARLRTLPYTRSKELWVPLHLWSPKKTNLNLEPLPTIQNRQVTEIRSGSPLIDYMFYLDAGHGGPDPGAIGRRGKDFLYEDEYAYDITLRLAERLQEFGASVKMIVQDPDDGIREDAILAYDVDERYCDNTAISHDLAQRLADRAAIVNRLYRRNKARFRNQIALIIHVDSRSNSQRVDIFYYHQEGVKESRELAATLHEIIESKYELVQPGRGYDSSISSRKLHMLSALDPVTVYIELGNIRNPKDQERFIIPDNRQAVANWLCDGLIAAAQKKK
jgi:N-acetylmuramoyl-L-alanine amidase